MVENTPCGSLNRLPTISVRKNISDQKCTSDDVSFRIAKQGGPFEGGLSGHLKDYLPSIIMLNSGVAYKVFRSKADCLALPHSGSTDLFILMVSMVLALY